MRVFITVLVLIFSLQSWTKADDITEFEIDGMSIGDSLLDYYSKNEINKMLSKTVSTYKNKRIKRVYFKSKDGSNYLQYNFHYINDESYKIVNVKGLILMENKSKECNTYDFKTYTFNNFYIFHYRHFLETIYFFIK